MDEWQTRMRAQKQKERENKNQAEESLRNYRKSGLSDEDELLRKIRLEEQQKKKEAAQLLTSYRPNADSINANLSTKKQSTQTKNIDGPLPVSALAKDDPRNAISAGAVSSIAANFDKSTFNSQAMENEKSSVITDSPMSAEQQDGTSLTMDTIPNPNGENSPASSGLEQSTDTEIQSLESEQAMAKSNDGQTEVVEAGPQTAGDVSQSDLAADWVDVKSEEILRSETPEMLAEKPLQGRPTLVRLDVDFSFGLISANKKPLFDAYMEAVENVVMAALDENDEMNEHVSYNPKFQPFVENVERDGTYFKLACLPD